MNTTFNRWLSAITQTGTIRKSALTLAGLAFATTGVTGPTLTAPTFEATPTAVTQTVTADKPSADKLIPHDTQGAQQHIRLDDEQTRNVQEIVTATKKADMDERAAVIAVGTALQESKLENLGHLGDRNDHDSQGLFQQRPSSGWGTVEQITDPEYATTAFLKALKNVDGWQDMALTDAAQTVQVSAYPDAYAKWEAQAADLVAQAWTK